MRRDAPEPWASAMVDAGHVWAGRPSIRKLAEAAQNVTGTERPSLSAVHKMVHGLTRPEDSTVNAVADALRVPRATVAAWVGQARATSEPWTPPEVADRLTPRQRAALDELIRAMVDRQDVSTDAATTTRPAPDRGPGRVTTAGRTPQGHDKVRKRPSA